jgi:hypothetical protein
MAKTTKPQGGLTIASIDIENFKRIKCVQFAPKGKGLTTIGGKNRAGKTSNLTALQMGFSGGKYKPTDIHNDSGGPGDYAKVNITTTNGYKVRIFGRNGTIEVTDPDGMKGGITLFGDAVSSFATDLRPFIQANATEKYKILVAAMGIGDLLESIEAERKTAYTARTVANGIAAKADTVFKAAVKPDPDVEIPKEVDVVKLSTEITNMNQANNEISQQASAREKMLEELEAAKDKVADLEQALTGANTLMGQLQAKVDAWGALPDFFDGSPLQAQMDTANDTNKKRTKALKAQDIYDQALQANQEAQQGATDAQEALNEVLTKKNNAVTELGELPNDDITLEDGKMLYKGKEWDCVSGADEYIIASEIGLATNKGCNFVLADGLERMDEDEQAKYNAWGEKIGAQLIGTVVTGDPKKCNIFIEDGCVKDS